MQLHRHTFSAASATLLGLMFLLPLQQTSAEAAVQSQASATADFNSYIQGFESRQARQHQSQTGFLAPSGLGVQTRSRLRRGDLIIENLNASSDPKFPGAILHHWRGAAFVAGARITDFERVMKDFNSYPRYFAPDVIQARLLSERRDAGVDHITASMRIRRKYVITVVMDMTYDVTFARLDDRHGYSISRSTRILEIDSPGTNRERALGAGEEHGFLWRLNTYWAYEESDGGLYMKIETVSLTRSIPTGLGWVIQPFVESVPRQSLEFTLRSVCNVLRR
jgi:hypothetical protein